MSSDKEEASHMIVAGESICRVEECPFFEAEKPPMGSLQQMRLRSGKLSHLVNSNAHFPSQEGKWQGLSFHRLLSLIIAPSRKSDWYLRSQLSVIQILTLEFKIPLTSREVSIVRFHPLVNLRALGSSKATEATGCW